ncbi:hypothetical protein L208DRAFT_1416545 [Tricholoma matsutake]|nr:hypothetical protein L208DRAFT_1416545 [Tricholoma matsutake 945]
MDSLALIYNINNQLFFFLGYLYCNSTTSTFAKQSHVFLLSHHPAPIFIMVF